MRLSNVDGRRAIENTYVASWGGLLRLVSVSVSD